MPPESALAETDQIELIKFSDIEDQILESVSRARSQEVKDSWSSLLRIVRQLSSAGNSSVDVVSGHRWWLAKVRVSGYQGVASIQPVEISFDPTPGVTVLHGNNGSGKSSISDAIETALHGKAGARVAGDAGRAGNSPLWSRVHCGRDTDTASVELTLADGNARLNICWKLERGTGAETVSVWYDDSTKASRVELGAIWREALIGHMPVFAYAALEQRVQRSKDLRDYLGDLLALGGCFEAISLEVERLAKEASDADATWRKVVRTTQGEVARIDASFRRNDDSDLVALTIPMPSVEANSWLDENELMETGRATAQVSAESSRRIANVAKEALVAVGEYRRVVASVSQKLGEPLKRLYDEATKETWLPEDPCPVCRTVKADWLDRLAITVASLTSLDSTTNATKETIERLRSVTEEDLSAVREVVQSRSDESVNGLLATGATLADSFLTVLREDGTGVTRRLLSAVEAIAGWLCAGDAKSVVEFAVRESDYRRQWLRARRVAVEPLVSIWPSTGATAAKLNEWKSVQARVGDLRRALREARTHKLTSRVAARVDQLLQDSGIKLQSVRVLETKADVRIVEDSNSEVDLGMLSAGQRNALLLAPLLAVADGGPFRFLVLDDPVHAFDQVRVDRFARVVCEIAAERRVVVLTHDERLREHLLALNADCDARSVSRAPDTGIVDVARSKDMWQALIDDARDAFHLARSSASITAATTSLVRGLCRQAVDNAVRQFVITRAVEASRDWSVDTRELDKAKKTRDRLAVAARIVPWNGPGLHPSESASRLCDPYLDFWNQAIHGNVPTIEVTKEEIDAASSACRRLTRGAMP